MSRSTRSSIRCLTRSPPFSHHACVNPVSSRSFSGSLKKIWHDTANTFSSANPASSGAKKSAATRANVANLLLARAHARQREWSIRQAIGASRGRLLRQSLTESLLLASAGAILGLGLAAALLQTFVLLAPAGLPRLAEASLDVRVLGAAGLLTVGCTFLFGLAPFAPQRSRWFRPGLVIAQIALTFVLLSSAATFLQTLITQLQTPLGMRPEQTLIAEISLHRERYADRA